MRARSPASITRPHAYCETYSSDLIRRSIALVLVHTESSLRADLHRHRLIEVIGADHIFDTLREALAAISGHRVHVLPAINPEGGHQYR